MAGSAGFSLKIKTPATLTGAIFMERAMGIEPTSKAWEAFVLPMNYARK